MHNHILAIVLISLALGFIVGVVLTCSFFKSAVHDRIDELETSLRDRLAGFETMVEQHLHHAAPSVTVTPSSGSSGTAGPIGTDGTPSTPPATTV